MRIKKSITVPKSIENIHNIFKENEFKLFLVGGAVRDSLMNINPKDFDLATDAIPDKVKELLPMYETIESGEQFAVVNVVTDEGTYEIATFREDIGKGRRPDEVKFSTIEKDVLRRDLTINALFYDLDTNEVVDLVGGIEDLKNGVVRTVGKATDRFNEDKLRIMRAIRFTSRVGSTLHKDVFDAIMLDKTIISGDGKPLSQERIQDEFVKGINQSISVVDFLNMLDDCGLFNWVFHDLKTDGIKVESKDLIVVLSTLLVNNDNLDKVLVNDLKFNKSVGKQVKFLVEFSKKISVKTAFNFKTKFKDLNITDKTILDFSVIIGMDMSLVKSFIKYEITTKGEDLINLGFKGKSLGVEKERLETEKFKTLL